MPTSNSNYTSAGIPVDISDTNKIAMGREASIHKINAKEVAKVYFDASHPSLQGQPLEQQAATLRIAELYARLTDYPKLSNDLYVNPIREILYRDGSLRGYVMNLLTDNMQFAFYLKPDIVGKINWKTRLSLVAQIDSLLKNAHALNVILGDGMSPRNFEVLKDKKLVGVDTLTYQYGKFYCTMLTDRVVDPRLLASGDVLDLKSPYDKASDLYGLYVLSFETLTFTNPYSGFFPPKASKTRGIKGSQRRQQRVTVFDPDVTYPSGLPHWNTIDEELLNLYYTVFTTDKRPEFPIAKWNGLTLKTCNRCGTEYTRHQCPTCTSVAAPAVVSKTQISKQVEATQLFQTTGTILYVQPSKEGLRFVFHDGRLQTGLYGTSLKTTVIDQSPLQVGTKYRFQAAQLWQGLHNKISGIREFHVDSFQQSPVFDSNSKHLFVLKEGSLQEEYRDNNLWLSRTIGAGLPNQTYFWVNEQWGLGFTQANNLVSLFKFDAANATQFGNIEYAPNQYLFKWSGQLLDSAVYFSQQYAWLFYEVFENNQEQHYAMVIDMNTSKVIHHFDPTWVGDYIKGRWAFGNRLFTPTSQGISMYDLSTQSETVFDATKPYVNQQSKLFLSPEGMYVSNHKQLWNIKLK